MNRVSQAFRSWVLEQRPKGIAPTCQQATGGDSYLIDAGTAVAQVNIWPYQDDLEIAEYLITRTSDSEVIFYLHVLLDDLNRAKDLFSQMVEAFEDEANHTTTHVMLCCTSAMTTTLFAAKMSEVAQGLSLDYNFTALSSDRALATEDQYAAIMLAPQASHLRKQMVEAHPDAGIRDSRTHLWQLRCQRGPQASLACPQRRQAASRWTRERAGCPRPL